MIDTKTTDVEYVYDKLDGFAYVQVDYTPVLAGGEPLYIIEKVEY